MRCTLIICSAILCSRLFAQSDSVDLYIKKLDWSSVEVVYNTFPTYALMGDTKKILAFEDPDVKKKLFSVLLVKKKTVAAHMLLTWLCDTVHHPFTTTYFYSGSYKTIMRFSYNGLEWGCTMDGQYYLKDANMKKIWNYWRTQGCVNRE